MRHTWLLEPRAGVRIELALDRGWIEAQGNARRFVRSNWNCSPERSAICSLLAAELQVSLPLHPEAQQQVRTCLPSTGRRCR
jgi:hypothetical protein